MTNFYKLEPSIEVLPAPQRALEITEPGEYRITVPKGVRVLVHWFEERVTE